MRCWLYPQIFDARLSKSEGEGEREYKGEAAAGARLVRWSGQG